MNVSLIFQKKSSSSWWGFTEAPGRIVQRMMPRLTASAVKHIAVKVPINNTPWFYYDWHNTVWCKHYVFTALCAPSLPEGSEDKNLNSAMQSEPLFSRCSKWSFEDIRKKEWRNCQFLIPETWSCFFFTVCLFVPETLNLWGQTRSQVRSSGTGLHAPSSQNVKPRRNICIFIMSLNQS